MASNHNDAWYNSGLTVERQSDGTLLTIPSTSSWKRISPLSNDNYFSKDFVCEFDIVDITTQLVFQYINQSSEYGEGYHTSTGHWKYTFTSNRVTRQKDNGIPTSITNVDGNIRVNLMLANSTMNVKIANFIIYSI